jgi:hypothetical protein
MIRLEKIILIIVWENKNWRGSEWKEGRPGRNHCIV